MRDEVDRLVADWRRARPELDLAPIEIFSRVTRLARHLDRARATAFANTGVTAWEFDVLAALRRAGPPPELSPGRLLRETLVTSGTMTTRVDRLSQRGLVVRRPDPGDRRGVLVRLTAPGATLVDDALDALLDAERHLLAHLDPADAADLATGLRRLLAPWPGARPS